MVRMTANIRKYRIQSLQAEFNHDGGLQNEVGFELHGNVENQMSGAGNVLSVNQR